MDSTPRLAIPYLLPNQAQKHVTLNEALDRVDNLVGAFALSRNISAQPTGPNIGDAYILSATPSGAAWSLHAENDVLAYRADGWHLVPTNNGIRIWVADESQMVVRLASGWQIIAPSSYDQFGVNTSANTVNRLAVKSDAVLLSHDDVTPGSGDMRQAINRLSAAHVGSLLFQTASVTGAEIGQVGTNDLGISVSADGSSFTTGLRVRTSDGKVAIPEGFTDPFDVQNALAIRHSFGSIDNDAIATLDFGGPIYGGAMLLVPNSLTSGPAVFFFTRMAPSAALTTLFSAGHSFTTSTSKLMGTTGTGGRINFSALDDGRFIIENRRGYGVGYTAFIFG